MNTPVQGKVLVTVTGAAHPPQRMFDVLPSVFHYAQDECRTISTTAVAPHRQHPSVSITETFGNDLTIDLGSGHLDEITHIIVTATCEPMEASCRCPCPRQQDNFPTVHEVTYVVNNITRKVTFSEEDQARCIQLFSLIRSDDGWHIQYEDSSATLLLEAAKVMGINLIAG